MNFLDALRARINSQVQVVTEAATYAGILTAVNNGTIVVRTSPNYGPTEDVTILASSIDFVRVFTF